LIVAHHAGERLRGPASQIVEIKLRNKRGRNIVVAPPAEARHIEDVTFEFHEPHRSEAQLP